MNINQFCELIVYKRLGENNYQVFYNGDCSLQQFQEVLLNKECKESKPPHNQDYKLGSTGHTSWLRLSLEQVTTHIICIMPKLPA